jgi:hypothetical protein
LSLSEVDPQARFGLAVKSPKPELQLVRPFDINDSIPFRNPIKSGVVLN